MQFEIDPISGLADEVLYNFTGTGHVIRPPITPTTITWTEGMYSGDTPEGCARANAAAWTETLQFLSQHLT